MPKWLIEIARGMTLMAGAALIFSWFGVYNTGRMPFLERFGLWYMTMLIGGGGSLVFIPWIRDRIGTRWPAPVQVFVIAAVISVPITIALQIVSRNAWTPFALSVQYAYVLAVSLVMITLGWLYTLATDKPANKDNTEDPVQTFLERLPVKYRTAELYAVSSEDHYLRVHTSLGEDLILMRLADAMREMNTADGLQTHRSWWVVKAGVADTRREEGKLFLTLKSGREVPVSRTYLRAVKEAGLV